MLKTVAFLSLLLIAVLLVACKDNSTSLITSSAPELSTAAETVTWKTQDGDGPMVQKEIVPKVWDGASALEKGVLYSFSSLEQIKAAVAGDDEAAKVVSRAVDSFAQAAAGKMKTKSTSTQLGSVPPGTSVYVSVYANPMVVSATGVTSNGVLEDLTYIRHYILLMRGETRYEYIDIEYTDGQSHQNVIDRAFLCPASAYVYASVTSDGGMIDDYEQDSCE